MLKLNVHTLGGTIYELYVPDDCTVLDLKQLLVEITKYRIEIQTLIFKDIVRKNNDDKLTDYGIVDNSLLYLILKLSGD